MDKRARSRLLRIRHREELEALLHQVITSHEPELLPLVARARPMRLTEGEAEKLVDIISSELRFPGGVPDERDLMLEELIDQIHNARGGGDHSG